ncbi:hypothetical protein SAV14893_031290 [Streptomyces avermitilis]|uniref:Uncharacterized protein n=1 Tax=Streptomyces avermitilis TaxID=33903 RepID=A0A4D4MVB3_STRAX|nr:hypothetical protein SAVMC3_43270 [Streptomyces avermitilis]GDY63736.1 hypothetical protein SAV14893_031290 [Streptomyces avermitilis]GDY76121.1 hypothetical protein SAV31267_056060 [Streptomyces avermitilis]GDY85068.1 hypothetical protein SAVCW2_42670 [Streptomyces avermitilis]
MPRGRCPGSSVVRPYVDGEIRSHQSRADHLLLMSVRTAVRELYQESRELIDTYTREFRRLAKRGTGVT